jgi:hypothetical protein
VAAELLAGAAARGKRAIIGAVPLMATELSGSVEARLDAAPAPSAEAAWRAFVRRFLLFLLGTLAAVGLLNYFVNPTGLHPPRLLPTVNWNVRATKTELLKQAAPKPQALILGSSRAMKVRPALVEELTGLPTFNATVEGAMTEDDYVMLRYAVERAGAHPKLLLLAVDVEAFHNLRPSNVALAISDELSELAPGGSRLSRWKKFTRLYSWEETKLSWRSLRHAVAGYPTTWNRFDADGYLHYLQYERERAEGRYPLDRRIDALAADYVGRFQGYSHLDPARVGYLKDILTYARQRNMRVVMFLTTLHPRVIEVVNTKGYGARYAEVKRLLDELAPQYGAEVFDFTTAEKFGGQNDWFYDGSHIDERNADQMTRKMLARGDDAVR